MNPAFVHQLIGYNARRAALHAIALFLKDVTPSGLKPVKFSIMSLIGDNPGITASQVCAELFIAPPNLVALISTLEKKSWLVKRPHATDRRAQSLYLTPEGTQVLRQAEHSLREVEKTVAQNLTPEEHQELLRLLRKVFA